MTTSPKLTKTKVDSNIVDLPIERIFDLSPSEKEIKLNQGRVMYILDELINKVKISACLSRLLRNDACLLKSYLPPTEVNFIISACMHCSKGSSIKSVATVQNLVASTEKTGTKKQRITFLRDSKHVLSCGNEIDGLVDNRMAEVIRIIWENDGLREEIIEKFDMVPHNEVTDLVTFTKELREIIMLYFSKTAEEETKLEEDLRKIWFKLGDLEQAVESTKRAIDEQREVLGGILATKTGIINDYQSAIENYKTYVKDQIRTKTNESELSMKRESATSMIEQHELSEKAKNTVAQYETVFSNNMLAIKKKRDRRNKIEIQLVNWLNKYDANVGEKFAEYEVIFESYMKEKAKMDRLQGLYDEQEEEYQILLQQKEEEDEIEFNKRAFEFLMNRSARRIQRYWRAYWQRKIERKREMIARAKERKAHAVEKKEAVKQARMEAMLSGSKVKKEKKPKKEKLRLAPKEPTHPKGDLNVALGKKFKDDVFGALEGTGFTVSDTPVDINAQ